MKNLVTLLIVVMASPLWAIDKIYFGSCGKQYKDMPILNAIAKDDPDVFIFLGDNIYGDTENMSELKQKYDVLGNIKAFKS